jgi:RNA polymerase sigma-70 factor (ECF subfamily)
MSEHAPDQRSPVDDLVVRARSDREAFGRLYDAYYDRILRYCLRRLYPRAVAEDVCGDVFLFVARHIRSFRGTVELDFQRWVYRIATTEVHAHLRRTLRRNELLLDAVKEKRFAWLTAGVSPNDASQNDTAEALDWESVQQAISQLGLREQTVIVLRLTEGMSHDEIAKTLNIRSGAVRVAYSRALQKLRELLLPQFDRAEHQAGLGDES